MTELACRWCGKTLAEHVDAHPPGVAARVPCGLLKSGFLPRKEGPPVESDPVNLANVQRALLVVQPTAKMLAESMPTDDVVCALLWLANELACEHGIRDRAVAFYQSLAAIDRGGLPGLARELEQLRKEQR